MASYNINKSRNLCR